MNQTNSRIESKIPDYKLRCWSSISFLDREETEVSTVNAYRACKNNIEISIISTKYRQQYEILAGQETPFVHPRKVIISDPTSLIKKHQREGRDFLTIYANEKYRNHKGVNAKITNKIYLVDVMYEQHTKEIKIQTRITGSEQIDSIFCSPTIASYTTKSSIIPFM